MSDHKDVSDENKVFIRVDVNEYKHKMQELDRLRRVQKELEKGTGKKDVLLS